MLTPRIEMKPTAAETLKGSLRRNKKLSPPKTAKAAAVRIITVFLIHNPNHEYLLQMIIIILPDMNNPKYI